MQTFNKKRKKKIILIISLIVVVLGIGIGLYMILKPKEDSSFEELLKKNLAVDKTYETNGYTLKVKKVDDYSFDRILEVTYNDEKVDFESIKYTDGITLCKGDRPVTYYGNISSEKELVVVLKDKSEIIIKIGEEK